jgi:metal-responsive CopG/Arc/MetJ family transcriptional regulator
MAPAVRTAVSLRRTLFQQADALAGRLRLTRSALFSRALEEFVRRFQNRELLDQLNAAYYDAPDESERVLQSRVTRLQRRSLKGKR